MVKEILTIGKTLITKIFKNKEDQVQAQKELESFAYSKAAEILKGKILLIKSEAESEDNYVRRARPTFLYVIYIYLLSALPFAVFYVCYPDKCKLALEGFAIYLNAIPSEFITLFGIGYLGYTGARQYGKFAKLKNLNK